ncbi:hypothetical protein [Streptomyces sp. NPDC046197]|uniref:hypothetical protein n=1 Tax=Streptomyces sp. NPDC046197 TaxID=3154337 RepID=UPI0033D77CB1
MSTTPYLPRQLEVLNEALLAASNPMCILVYDTQGVGPLIEHMCGRPGAYEELVDGIAWFRISNYLPTGERLVERVVEASQTADWVFLHVGTGILPEPVLHLLKFIADSDADAPKIVVVGECADVTSGNRALQQLFLEIGTLIPLVARS